MSERISPDTDAMRRKRRKRRKRSERGRRDKEIICEHMAPTAYEMYSYCLQFPKRSVVAKNSGQ